MSASYTFAIPGPPKGKGRPRFARIGKGVRAYTDTATESYEAKVATLARPAGVQPLEGPVMVVLTFVLPRPLRLGRRSDPDDEIPAPARPDLDNLVKSVLDGLNGVAWADDGAVTPVMARKRYTAKGRAPEVRVSLCEDPT